MRVYVLNMKGQPLMPCSPRKARVLLRDGKAKVIKRTPFTIQLKIATGETKQPVVLGIDAGSKKIGVSASTEDEELYAAEIQLRTDIVDLLSTRRQFRRQRRNRKTRYRKPRYLNRKGFRFAPSVEHKINTHLTVIKNICKILPVSKLIVETAAFDIQKIKNPDIQGKEYQTGEQFDFNNVLAYVMHRDGHRCHGRNGCKNKYLNVHHIESRKTGGDSPGNLITLCKQCHSDYHAGKLKLDFKRKPSFRDAAFMGIMRWEFYKRLKQIYQNVSMTFGYKTKAKRLQLDLPKEHRYDAFCIANNLAAKHSDVWYSQKAVRRQNRQLHKATINKGGYRKANKAERYVFGYQLFDKVLCNGKVGFIFGRRKCGSFDVRQLDGTVISAGISYKKLKLIERSKALLSAVNCGVSAP